MNELNLLAEMQFGSHLYGTDTPESDLDIKGVYLPHPDDVLLQRVKKSIHLDIPAKGEDGKNVVGAVDREYYSPQYFIHLLCKGETVALDMLHAPAFSHTIQPATMWVGWTVNRHRAYSKNMAAFVGYARRQAAKYGLKGSRLDEAQRLLDILQGAPDHEARFEDVWGCSEIAGSLWEHGTFEVKGEAGYFRICGISLQGRARIRTVIEPLQNFVEKYGARARLARENEGIDWKAISHALRAAFQLRSMFTNHASGSVETGWTYPLPEADLLRQVKVGGLDYLTVVAPMLDNLIEEVEVLAADSKLPEQVDTEWWQRKLVEDLRKVYEIE